MSLLMSGSARWGRTRGERRGRTKDTDDKGAPDANVECDFGQDGTRLCGKLDALE